MLSVCQLRCEGSSEERLNTVRASGEVSLVRIEILGKPYVGRCSERTIAADLADVIEPKNSGGLPTLPVCADPIHRPCSGHRH